MRRRLALAGAAIAALVGGGSVAAEPATPPPAPQAYAPTSLRPEPGVPRTREGRPDLQGVVWYGNFFGLLETNPLLPAELTLSEDKAKQAFDRFLKVMLGNPTAKILLDADPEASALLANTRGFPIVRGQRRSRFLVQPADGKLPYTAEARRDALGAIGRLTSMKADNPEDRLPGERCITLGAQPPIMAPSPLHPIQFVQTRNDLAIQTEYGDETRIIPFAKAHTPGAAPSVMGDSIARWEGDTLVIETTGFLARDKVRGGFPVALVVNPDATVIERYTRLSRDELLYQYTVVDPKAYAAPWLAEYSLYRAPFRMYPSTCHEGNYSLPNILAGARQEELRKVEALRLISETTADPAVRWTTAFTNANDARSWAVLSPKDAAGEARVALRVEFFSPRTPADGSPSLSEIDLFAVDCSGGRVKLVSVAAFGAHNLTGAKSALAFSGDWQPASTRPAIAAGIKLACSNKSGTP